jgi:integrase
VIVALETGLRPSETFGLKRTNIDLGDRVVRVRQTWSRYKEGAVKNRRSRRDVKMSEMAYRAFREQLAETELRFSWLWPISVLHPVPHNPQNFSRRYWKGILQRAAVPHREFYQCRHTFATNQLAEGCELQWIADQMGHKDLRMLIDRYLKWKPGSVEDVRKAF